MTFDFISNIEFRSLLERDFEELNKCLEANCTKSVLVLSGSIIEALLADYFINFPKEGGPNKKKVLNFSLNTLIDLALDEKLISSSTKDLSTVIKNYRNLIHPGREIRTSESFDQETAIVAKSLLNIIIKEVRENYLNNIGYSAKDLIAKLESDSLSELVFEKILEKVHKNEKARLYEMLIDNECDDSQYALRVTAPKKYMRILKSKIDREVIEKQLRKMIYKIETGTKWEVLIYYDLLNEDLNYLEEEEVEFIMLYVLSAFTESASDKDEVENHMNRKLFSTFGTHLSTESLKKEYLKLVCALVKNHHKYDYVYFSAYDQLINSVSADKKEKIQDYVIKNVNSYYQSKFYEGYDDGNFLPF